MDGPILVPTDGSDPATAAVEHALDVAAATNVPVHALYVADTNEPSLTRLGDQVVDVLETEGEEVVDRVASMAGKRGVTVVDSVLQGEPRDVILEYIDARGIELVIMGAHGRRGIGEYVFGTTTETVVTESDVPVLTVRAGDDATHTYPYEDIVVPTDDSDHARAALDLGADIAARDYATVHLLFVVDDLPETIDPRSATLPEEAEQNAREFLREVAADPRLDGRDVTVAVEAGSVANGITSYVQSTNADLVVMGTHGRSGFDRYLVGSFTERVIRTSPVPVLTTTAEAE